jgi:hypothetical protein
MAVSIAVFFFLITANLVAQDKPAFRFDLITGPYLFVDHHLYKSVYLNGARVGYSPDNQWTFSLEYLAGQQEDEAGEKGMTHHTSLQAARYLIGEGTTFRPYLYAGGGFLEFKDFSRDKYGMAWYGGMGLELNLHEKIKGLLEPRYLNIAPMNLGAKNELGMFWGVRVNF